MVEQNFWEQFQTAAQNRETTSQIPETPVTNLASTEEPQQFSWGNLQTPTTYQVEKEEAPSALSEIARISLSHGARFGEAALGRYGDIQKGVETALTKFPAVGGILGSAISELVGPEAWKAIIQGQPSISPHLPTSSEFKGVTETLTGDYTKPKGKLEKYTQEFASDVGSLGRGLGGGTRNVLVNNLGIPAAATAAKATVEELGFGEDKATWTKLAAWTALSLLANVNAPQYAAQLMNNGRQGFGQNIRANIPRYENRIDQVSRNMLQGDPRSALAQQQIAGIRNDIANGQTSMQDLMNRYDALNAAKRDRGLFELTMGDRRAAIRNINQVRDTIREEIQHLGQANPAALRDWENGVQAFATIHQTQGMTNRIQRWLTGPYAKAAAGPVAGVFGAGVYGAAHAPLVGIGAVTVGPAVYKTGQVATRIWQDPTLATYYWDAMQAAQAGNESVFLKNFIKLNDIYEKKYGSEK